MKQIDAFLQDLDLRHGICRAFFLFVLIYTAIFCNQNNILELSDTLLLSKQLLYCYTCLFMNLLHICARCDSAKLFEGCYKMSLGREAQTFADLGNPHPFFKVFF